MSSLLKSVLNSIKEHKPFLILSRNAWNTTHFDKPNVSTAKTTNYRRLIFMPKDFDGNNEYTIRPLKYRNLGGRDPISGRVTIKHLGGGIREVIHAVHNQRLGPTEDVPPKEERVLKIIPSVSKSVRTAHLALVGDGDILKFILATQNMQEGDILKTSSFIPRIPVRAKEGDAYPLGALPVGSVVCCVEKYPGVGGFYARSAGNCATIVRSMQDKVVLQLPSKQEVALDKRCMATVGRISNQEHSNYEVGSPNRQRELGNRPYSGLWHRKTGHDGRKIRPLPPLKIVDNKRVRPLQTIQLTIPKLNMKTKAKNLKTGLGYYEEPLYEERIRQLKIEDENKYEERLY